jgi:hypothetical protein
VCVVCLTHNERCVVRSVEKASRVLKKFFGVLRLSPVACIRIHDQMGVRDVLAQDERVKRHHATSLLPCTMSVGWRMHRTVRGRNLSWCRRGEDALVMHRGSAWAELEAVLTAVDRECNSATALSPVPSRVQSLQLPPRYRSEISENGRVVAAAGYAHLHPDHAFSMIFPRLREGAIPLQVFGRECLRCTLGRRRCFGKGGPNLNGARAIGS